MLEITLNHFGNRNKSLAGPYAVQAALESLDY